MPSPRALVSPERGMRVGTAKQRDASYEHTLSRDESMVFSQQRSILHNWDECSVADDPQLTRELYNEAIKAILDQLGGFPEVNLRDIPNYRTSKQHILKTKVPKTSEMQMVPKLPSYMQEQTGEDYDKSRISAGYLESKKERHIYNLINQTLNGTTDEAHKKKYYHYLVSHGITIVSDIFERMDMDRKIIESLRHLQAMDNLSEEEYYHRKQQLMRKLTAKATKFLYEREKREEEITLEKMVIRK